MPRHHNRAILSQITEQNLDPTKEYVAGKNGLTLSSKELKKISVATTSEEPKKPQVQVQPQAEVVAQPVVASTIETKEEEKVVTEAETIVEETVETLAVDEVDTSSDKTAKSKKKNKKAAVDQS